MNKNNKHAYLTEEKQKEHGYSSVVRNSSVNKLKGRHGKKIGGYKSVAGRGFRTK